MKKILYTVLILLILACPVFSAQGANGEDTLYVSGKAVVFFGPSQSQYLAMTHEQKDAIDETLYDFYHNRGEVSRFLSSNAIQVLSTARHKIQIQFDDNQSFTYLREDFDRLVGLILTDGRQEPLILLGATAVSEMITLFEEFFDL